MKRWEAIAAMTGLLLIPLALGAGMLPGRPASTVHDEVFQTNSCRVTTTVYSDASRGDGNAVIIHGLSANRKLMEPVAQWMAASGLRTYSLDMPGHGDSDEPFSFQRAEQCAAEFFAELTRRGVLDPARTVLIGHSTGAGIAIRLADHFDAAATIAISPAPLTPQPPPFNAATPFLLPHRLPANLLVFIASLDPWPIRDSAKEWIARAGGTRDSDADFAARRALRLTNVPRANHTSLLIDSAVAGETVHWLQRALRLEQRTPDFRTPPFAFAIALLGLFLLFPACATRLLGRAPSAGPNSAPPGAIAAPDAVAIAAPFHPGYAYTLWAIASLLAVLLLKLWIPLRPVRLFSGDYLASFLLLVGLIAIAACWKQSRAPLSSFLQRQISDLPSASAAAVSLSRSLLASVVLAFAFFLPASGLLSWQLTDVWLNGARWLRFPWLLPPMLVYALAEELALGPPRPAGGVFRRLLRALGLRMILLAATVAALLLLASNQILIPLLAHFMLLFSVCQRLGADAMRRRTGSALSAAVFSAILAAWYIAAVFPLL